MIRSGRRPPSSVIWLCSRETAKIKEPDFALINAAPYLHINKELEQILTLKGHSEECPRVVCSLWNSGLRAQICINLH